MLKDFYEKMQDIAINRGKPRVVHLSVNEYGNGFFQTSDGEIKIYFESLESLTVQLAQYKETEKV